MTKFLGPEAAVNNAFVGMCNNLARSRYLAILLYMLKEPTKEEQVLALAGKAKILRVQDLGET